jgi:hypothetical protein
MRAAGTNLLQPYGPAPNWTSWYVRALLRSQCTNAGISDGGTAAQAQALLQAIVEGQRHYHRVTADRLLKLHTRLSRTGFWLSAAAALITLASVAIGFHVIPDIAGVKHISLLATAVLPVLAAALYGIRMIGEFESLSRRSARMSLERGELLDVIQEGPLDQRPLRELVLKTNEILLGDIAAWRLGAESRELEMLG